MTSLGASLLGIGVFAMLYVFIHTRTRLGRDPTRNAFAAEDQRLAPWFFRLGLAAAGVGVFTLALAALIHAG